jgi:hypothetical protein
MGSEKRSDEPSVVSNLLWLLGSLLAVSIAARLLLDTFPTYIAILIMFGGCVAVTYAYYRVNRINVPFVGWFYFTLGWLGLILMVVGSSNSKSADAYNQLLWQLGLGLWLLDCIILGAVYLYRKWQSKKP